jgi:hypothetical protein
MFLARMSLALIFAVCSAFACYLTPLLLDAIPGQPIGLCMGAVAFSSGMLSVTLFASALLRNRGAA